jgi:hypothetical protein
MPSREHVEVVGQSGCHPEQADVAQRRIWATRAKRRGVCDATIARLDRFHFKATHYRMLTI